MSQRFSIQNTEHFNPHYKSYVTLTTTVIYNFNGNPELSTVVMISQVISAFYKAFGQTFIKAGGHFNGTGAPDLPTSFLLRLQLSLYCSYQIFR